MSRKFKTTVQLDSGLIIPANAALGKVLTSDGSGNAAWAAASGGSTKLATKDILDVGTPNQVRAGRPFVLADFTTLLGLAAPIGIFNLSDLSNLGTAGALSNKGAVTFTRGITGAAGEAAQFSGSVAQALYIADSVLLSPRSVSVGAWFRTGKQGVDQQVMSKYVAAQLSFQFFISGTTHTLCFSPSVNGTTEIPIWGRTIVDDDRWHFGVGTYDGTTVKVYVDGKLDGSVTGSGFMFDSTTPFNIGARSADGAIAAALPFFGVIDDAFITADVLFEEQIRLLYAAKLPHGASVLPTTVDLAVRRKIKGAPFVSGDFPSQPIRLHNFTAGALTDAGSGNVTLTNNGTAVSVPGADGVKDNALNFNGTTQWLSAADAGLPDALLSKSYGCWFKTLDVSTNQYLVGWGPAAQTSNLKMWLVFGVLESWSGNNSIIGPFVADGNWHFVVTVEDNTAQGTVRANGEMSDGVKRKLYLDGKLVGTSLVMNTTSLSGTTWFNIGGRTGGPPLFVGQMDGVFVHNIALTPAQVAKLYAVSSQASPPSPKNAGDHVEAIDASNLYVIHDSLESQHQVDYEVA